MRCRRCGKSRSSHFTALAAYRLLGNVHAVLCLNCFTEWEAIAQSHPRFIDYTTINVFFQREAELCSADHISTIDDRYIQALKDKLILDLLFFDLATRFINNLPIEFLSEPPVDGPMPESLKFYQPTPQEIHLFGADGILGSCNSSIAEWYEQRQASSAGASDAGASDAGSASERTEGTSGQEGAEERRNEDDRPKQQGSRRKGTQAGKPKSASRRTRKK